MSMNWKMSAPGSRTGHFSSAVQGARWPHDGGESLDQYLPNKQKRQLKGTSDPYAQKFPTMGEEALDKEYKG